MTSTHQAPAAPGNLPTQQAGPSAATVGPAVFPSEQPDLGSDFRATQDAVSAANKVSRRGYFGVGIEHTKTASNVGSLWRSASIFGASFIFTVGRRYKRQSSDTMKTWRHIPLIHFDTLDDLWRHIPHDCRVVGVELAPEARWLAEYAHPERALYLLGAEDHGLTKAAMLRCHDLIKLPGDQSMNVAVAGSIVVYDRVTKAAARSEAVA